MYRVCVFLWDKCPKLKLLNSMVITWGSAARTRGGTVHGGEGPGADWGPGGSGVRLRHIDTRSHV